MEGDGEASLIAVVVDFNAVAWSQRSKALNSKSKTDGAKQSSENDVLELPQVLDVVQTFLHSVLMLHRDNDVAVYAACPDGTCRLLYPDHRSQTKIIELGQIHYKVSKRLKLGIRATSDIVDGKYKYRNSLAASLSCALCYCNRLSEKYQKAAYGTKALVPRQRILLLNVSEEDASQYVTTMNAAFAAQKMNIPIDICDFTASGLSLLQQVSHLTNGLLIRATDENSAPVLTQLFWNYFLPDLNTR